jgi:hypothetical protein
MPWQNTAGTFGLITVTLVKDQLYFWDIPLFPQSETTVEFQVERLTFPHRGACYLVHWWYAGHSLRAGHATSVVKSRGLRHS